MTNQNVIEPTPEVVEQSKQSSRALSKYHSSDSVFLQISGSDGPHDDIVLPGVVMQMLLDILSEFSKGNAVGVIPHKAEMSTQQAANLLNVSRPHLVKLLERGEISFKKVGSHRRVEFGAIKTYKDKVDRERESTLDELGQLSQDLDMGY